MVIRDGLRNVKFTAKNPERKRASQGESEGGGNYTLPHPGRLRRVWGGNGNA